MYIKNNETYNSKSERVFHESTAAAQKRDKHNNDGGNEQNVDSNEINLYVKQCDPFAKVWFGGDPNCQSKQTGANHLQHTKLKCSD